MKTYEIVGYAYDAACHCLACTEKRFGTAHPPAEGTHGYLFCIDHEGNEIHPIFAGDEGVDDECCDDCGGELV